MCPPPGILDAIDERVSGVAMTGGRRTAREQWHITLQFLGNGADVDAVTSALQSEPVGLGAGEVRLSGADALGNRRRARIVALGLCDGEAWMRELANAVERRLAPLGYTRVESEPFVAHLTLARFRAPTDLRGLCAAVGPEPVGPSWSVDEFVLFESILGPEGARHVLRAKFPVGT